MGKPPMETKQVLSKLKEWMDEQGITTLFDLSIWNELDKNRWLGWKCISPPHLTPTLDLFFFNSLGMYSCGLIHF